MLRGRLLAAAAALLVLAAASWLPALGSDLLTPGQPDLGRPPLPPLTTRPLMPRGPVEAARDFFLALAGALAQEPLPGPRGRATTPPAPSSPAAPAPPAEEAPDPPPGGGSQRGAATALEAEDGFAAAYAYLDPAWRQRLSFATFVAGWRPFRHLDLLAAVAAGHPPFDPRSVRVFVEVRSLVPSGEGLAVAFSYGFYVAAPTAQGWRLTGGGLRPEGFGAFAAGAGSADDATAVALAAARARALAAGVVAAPGPVTFQAATMPNVQLARVRLGTHAYTVMLYRLVDGGWVALETTGG